MIEMKRHMKEGVRGLRLLPFYLFTFLLFLAACTSIDCPVQNLVYTQYAFKKADGSTDTLNTDTLWIKTTRVDGNDTLLLNALCGTDATHFNLQISYTQPEDVFVTLLTDTSGCYYIDTIRIKKENYPHFESVDCQAAYFHKLTDASVTHNAFDSISIHHSTVDYGISNYHFYLYLKKDRR
jgi:hypothetical protein